MLPYPWMFPDSLQPCALQPQASPTLHSLSLLVLPWLPWEAAASLEAVCRLQLSEQPARATFVVGWSAAELCLCCSLTASAAVLGTGQEKPLTNRETS